MKRFFAIFIFVLFCTAGYAQHRADRQNLTDPESFSMILLGDPQGYVKYDIVIDQESDR